MKNILYTFLFFTIMNSYSQKNKTFIMDKELITNFKFNNISMLDLNLPGEKFEKIKNLGLNLNFKKETNFIEEITTITGDGFTAIYININGYPELKTMVIKNLNAIKIYFENKIITQQEIISSLSKNKGLKNIYGKEIKSDEKEHKKFNNNYSYMEIIIDSEVKNIKEIIIKNKVI